MKNQQILDNIEKHYTIAQDLALQLVEQKAREMLVAHPELDEFVMAMGAWFFTYKVGAIDHNGIEIEEGMSRIVDEGSAEFIQDSDVAQIIADWDSVLHVTGAPMRFTATGQVVTDW